MPSLAGYSTGVGASARAVLFDLDGVLVCTDELHYAAWKTIADELGIAFDRERNHALRGVGRMESLERLLGARGPEFAPDQRAALAERKNAVFRASLATLRATDRLPGTDALLGGLRGRGARLAVVSASRNAREILDRVDLTHEFDAIVDGTEAPSKPDPRAFLLAAERLGVAPAACVVVEDAATGIQAARAAGMRAIALGPAARCGLEHDHADSLLGLTPDRVLRPG